MNNKNNKNIRGKYPKQPVITTQDQTARKAFYHATDAVASLRPGQIVTGITRHPDTGLWQVWLSTNGLDFTQLAVFKQSAKAAGAVDILKAEEKKGTLSNPNLVAALFQFLEQQSDGKVLPLPEDMVRKIARDIVHNAIEG